MGKRRKKIARDSLSTHVRPTRIRPPSDDSDTEIENRFRATQEILDQDEPIREGVTIRFGTALPITKRQADFDLGPILESPSQKARQSMAATTSLNVDLLETVVRIIDYTEIPELPPIAPQTRRSTDRKSIRKSRATISRKSRRTWELQEEEDDLDEAREVDLDDKGKEQFETTRSIEVEILNEWWDLKGTDSKERLRKGRATIAIGHKAFIIDSKAAARRVKTLSQEASLIIFYEENMNCQEMKAITRAEYKKYIGANAFERILKYTKLLLEHGASTYSRLTPFEFAVMLIMHEFNLVQNGHLGYNFERYGTFPTMVAHTFVLFCIEMPFVMKIMTLASFSQTYGLGFFRAIPLLVGIGYVTLTLYIIMQSEVALYFEGACRILIFLITTTDEWKDCPFINEKYVCIRFKDYSAHNCTKKKPLSPGSMSYSTQYFMNHVIFSLDDLQLPWYISHGPIVMWVVVLVVAINGIALIKKVTVRLQVWLCVLPALMANGVLIYRAYTVQRGEVVHQYNHMPWDEVFTADFIIDAITVGTKIHHLPYLIWVCAMKPVKASIEFYSALSIFIGILMTWASASLYISCLGIIAWTYNLDPTCIQLSPRDHAFSLVPDIMMHLSFAKSWLFMWFLSMLYFYALYVVYAINVTADTVAQVVPKMTKVSLVLTISVWAVICVLRYIRLNPELCEIIEYLQPEKFSIIGSILFGMMAFGLQFFYGQERFHDDFMFYNNFAPKKIWAITWHIIVFLGTIGMICGIIIQCLHATDIDESAGVGAGMVELMISFVAFVIIITFFVQRSCYWMYVKRLKESFNPDAKWGSSDPKMVLLRKFYFSARDIRARHTKLNCTHRCMLMAYEYKHTQYAQMMKLAKITDIHKRHRERREKPDP